MIQSVEEKRFYDVSLFYLTVKGFKDISIVDGTGDGGRDVITGRSDLRIQLSVRSKWEDKINEEVRITHSIGKHHLIYVTNKLISQQDEERFKQQKQAHKGEVDVSIHDLNRIATALSQAGVIRRAYEMMGMSIAPSIRSTPKDVALSTMLLFSREAKDLREHAVEAFVRAWMLKNPGENEDAVVNAVSPNLPGVDSPRYVRAALSRLRSNGRVVGKTDSVKLSSAETSSMEAAEDEYKFSTESDIQRIIEITSLGYNDARALLLKSVELLSRQRPLSGLGPAEEELRSFLAAKGLTSRKSQIFECLSNTHAAARFQYGETINHIFSTNTFDIYRALGGRTDISVILDTSVALPMIFGLEFGTAKSRYSLSATALQKCCAAHNLAIYVPKSYLNEMASHGLKALESIEGYNALSAEVRYYLRSSRNAYLSHFTHVSDSLAEAGIPIDLKEFLAHFGISSGKSLRSVENRIASILERQSIDVMDEGRPLPDIKKEIARRKPNEIGLIIDHDARVASLMLKLSEKGYIFATWDKLLIEIVENMSRVFAEQPSRIIDFLSMIEGVDFENERIIELQSALLHMEDRVSERVARQIERIKTAQHAYVLQAYIDNCRQRFGNHWSINPVELAEFLDSEEVGISGAQMEKEPEEAQ